MFEREFVTGGAESNEELSRLVTAVLEVLRHAPTRPYSGKSPAELARLLACDLDAEQGIPAAQLMERLSTVAEHSIGLQHPNAIAHLHCPTVIPAIAAELLTGALNPSMDSFDQAPAATMVELELMRYLSGKTGFPDSSGGVFTPGATQSNFFGLLLAREAALEARFSRCGWREGVGDEGQSLRILCSEVAHFTVEKSAAQLGLGTQTVVRVACDNEFRMSMPALRDAVRGIQAEGRHVMAIVGTAGTTDFGSIDPLAQMAPIARSAGAWFHVDAAYGGALLFSNRHRGKLAGIEKADSISIDLHKLLWQPISCGAFLVRDAAQFDRVRMHADYLNPEEHEDEGVPDLVTRSLLTSRRFDALKLWVSLQCIGRQQLEAMINRTLELATGIAEYMRGHARLEVLHAPTLGCVLFRYLPERQACDANRTNANIRRRLFESGAAVIGQTQVAGRTSLKLTCLNPRTTSEQLQQLVDRVIEIGKDCESRD